ncbi:MAG: sensor histidine kinase [Anaerolineae bacterium]|nr:sensor histidine kinase [Anaerolineae bacterium]
MELRALMANEDAAPVEAAATPADILGQTGQEYEQIQKELKEIDILIKQSTAEVEKLAQRNAQLTNKVRTMESNIDTVPRQDIKEIYTAAQEAQMRLFMMRGQVEQLQSRQENLKRFADSLHRVLEVSGSLLPAGGEASSVKSSEHDPQSNAIVKIIDAQETERQHLSNQLHDGPAQSLTNLILQAEICERLFDSDPMRARAELTELKHAVSDTFQKVRGFIFDLRPMMLDDLGLTPTLKKSIEDYQEKTGLACNLTISGKDTRLPPHTEVTVFRIIQQSLNNVRDHAQATHVQIAVDVAVDKITASVEDDGVGFDVTEALSASQQRKTIGLSTMQERIEMLGGELKIDSSPNKGTRIDFWLPAA